MINIYIRIGLLSLIVQTAILAQLHAPASKVLFPSKLIEDSLNLWGRVAPDIESLLKNTLIRIEFKDTMGLWQMGFLQNGFEKIYPKTPEGKDATKDQSRFAWQFFRMDNEKMLLRCLERNGGESYLLDSWKPGQSALVLANGDSLIRNIHVKIMTKDRSLQTFFLVKSIYKTKKWAKIWSMGDERVINSED